MIDPHRLLTLGTLPFALVACVASGQSGATGQAPAGGQRSAVEIIDGAQFSVTWENRPTTVLRLAYDAQVPVSDTRLVEIAQQMTGCTASSAPAETVLLGEIASVRLAASCPAGTPAPAGTTEV